MGHRPTGTPQAYRVNHQLPAVPLTESHFKNTADEVAETTVGGVLRSAAEEAPDRVALVEGVADPRERRRWTYRQLLSDAEVVARALAARFSKGERVAVWSPNSPEWVLLEYGCGLAGVVLVTVNPAFQAQELSYVLKQSGASGVFYLPHFRGNNMEAHLNSVLADLPELREVISLANWDEFIASAPAEQDLPDVSPDDPVQIQYTSGTTGFPKGAYLHHRGITNNARHVADRLHLDADSVYINPMPLFHTGGCVLGVLGPVQARATLVNLPHFDPGLMLELSEQEAGTHLMGVPTMLIALLEDPSFPDRNLERVRVVCSGGSTVPAELVRRIETSLGVEFAVIYGQTEASPGITLGVLDDSIDDKANTLGPLLPQVEVKVVDPQTGATQPIGVPGELCARGYLVMLGYYDMAERTAETIDGDGWLHTGDLVSMDHRGYTVITGRLKDMIIRGGENIYPREIEELLFNHPKVADVAVCGVPDDRWGEVVAAFIRDADGEPATDLELRDYLREHLSPQKTPTVWHRVAEFPLTPSGKVQKFQLVNDWEKGLHR